MKILLTGASGMVGRNILAHKDASDHEWLTPSSRELDLLNHSSVLRYMREHAPELVIHAAGVVGGIQANMANPVKFLVDNTLMGIHVLESAHASGVPNLLNLASSCMYPKDAENPLKESQVLTGALEPTNEGYALAKITASRLCEYISRTDAGRHYRTLIPCNLYGKYDKFDPKHSHMIPAVIRKLHEAARAEKASVDIWGDGTARREFMYAEDLADFIFYALPRLASMPQTLNVGLGQDYSINEYYQVIAQIVGFEGRFEHDLTKPVGMKRKLIDTTLLQEFGWNSKTSLTEGVRQTYSYFLKEAVND
ncbi:GDP-L-fucose synthase [Marinimicrobium sp. LS-A18]|uniref:GDP-L-fucose synthase family protein n=1 Tax=Marinimicrobium sp. LS-A18 TaxID=1381596 RepID=UPI0004648B90|nr:GDP-L-fucose synthase [Marinimicrobium sp. LS-A18]